MAVIKDVARLAGVSTGTVSKYLNHPRSLKEETRKHVEEAIRALQYRPSPLARSMRTGRTDTVAVVVPDIINPFYAEVYNAIRLSALQNGYTSILYTTEDDIETLKTFLSDPFIRRVDGLILCFLEEDEVIENLIVQIQEKIPIILLSWDVGNTRFNTVAVDVCEGIYKSTRHLIELGHRSIAYIGGPENDRISMEKFKGYTAAMHQAGYEVHPGYIHHNSYTLQAGYLAARSLSMLTSVPTAIVAECDVLAIGSIKYFHRRKIRVPEDIAVIGFDNIPFSAMYEPSLSTVALPIQQMGSEAAKLFALKLEKPTSKNRQVILNTRLTIRHSTDRTAPVEFE